MTYTTDIEAPAKQLRMNENIEFLQAFLKNPAKVGSISPSSPELAQKMIEGITPDKDNIIVELGVGTGAITKFLQDIVPDERSYLGIELDGDLVRSLNRNFGDMRIVHGNACEMSTIHQESGLGKVAYIVCCLPFVTLPNDVAEKILAEIDKFMQLGATFRILQYAHGYYFPNAIKLRRNINSRYGKSKKSPLIVKNVPPSYVLTWTTT